MGQDTINRAEANRLYWWSDEPVARIADQLDVSRRALYEAVQPLGTGAACPACGAELGFANRSARMNGDAACPDCGVQSYVDPDGGRSRAETIRYFDSDRASTASTDRDGNGAISEGRSAIERFDRTPDAREADLRHRAAVLGGAAIACMALGTVATLLARKRT